MVPAGTFNHFAADLGVESADDALAALRDGDSVLVDVGAADGAAFPNTASTGVYVGLVKARERLEPSLGKWPAMLIALADDSALRALADMPLGPWLLVIVAPGLMTFGVYSWCEARWRTV